MGGTTGQRRKHRITQLELGLTGGREVALAERVQRGSRIVPMPEHDRAFRGIEQVHRLEAADTGPPRQIGGFELEPDRLVRVVIEHEDRGVQRRDTALNQ